MRRKLVESRSAAQRAIDSGVVRVGSNPSPKASTLVSPDEPLHLTQPADPYVSRGGLKLAGALDAFDISVRGARAIDVGASTGGFTDCLLQRGAASVLALDVGYGQLHWSIRQDPRVEVLERTNIRTTDVSALGEPFGLVVADLSFISLRSVVGALSLLGSEAASWVLLVKPQFEAGRRDVGKGGIVRDQEVRSRTVAEVAEAYETNGMFLRGLIRSPITGATGNVEYVAWFRRTPGEVSTKQLLMSIKDSTG